MLSFLGWFLAVQPFIPPAKHSLKTPRRESCELVSLDAVGFEPQIFMVLNRKIGLVFVLVSLLIPLGFQLSSLGRKVRVLL